MTWAKQTVIVQKTHAKDRDEAKGIAKGFSDRMYTSRETGSSYRFRQAPPSKFVEGSFRTKKMPDKGVSIVYGQLKQSAMLGTTDNELNAPFVPQGSTIESTSQDQWNGNRRKTPLVAPLDVDTQEGSPTGFRKEAFARGFEKRAYTDEPGANQFLPPGSPNNPSGGTIEKDVNLKRPILDNVSPSQIPPVSYEAANLNSFFTGDERKYAMESPFIRGFEKRAYDYEYEAREGARDAEEWSKAHPANYAKRTLIGGGVGGLLGAGVGALAGGGRGAALGAMIGGASGAGIGALGGLSHNLSIEEGKHVMSMPEDERAIYLKAKAREEEQDANRAAMYAAAHSARVYAPYYQSHPYYY